MNAENSISPELQAKIDALPEGSVKKRVLRVLTGPGNRTATNEEIFANIMESVAEAEAERAKWRKWSNEEVAAFVEHYQHEMPEDFAEFVRQEREDNQIDSDLAWRARQLARKWLPDLDYVDYGSLLGKARDYVRADLVGRGEHHE